MTGGASSVLILGAGGHARVVLATLCASGAVVEGCLAPQRPDGRWPAEIPWLGTDEDLRRLSNERVVLANGVGSVGDSGRRRAAFELGRSAGFRFVILCHPKAIVEAKVALGEGAQIMAGAIVQTGVQIGSNAIVNTGAIVDHDSVIGDHAHVAPGARVSGGVVVGPAAHVGIGATIIQGVVVGAGALVAAGSVVVSNVPENACVAGVPAVPLRAK